MKQELNFLSSRKKMDFGSLLTEAVQAVTLSVRKLQKQ